jgi:hypothetical protein
MMRPSPKLILRTLTHGDWQRIDGLRCEPKVIDLSAFSFHWAMRWLRWNGYVERFWWYGLARRNRLPTYRITRAGRQALECADGNDGWKWIEEDSHG